MKRDNGRVFITFHSSRFTRFAALARPQLCERNAGVYTAPMPRFALLCTATLLFCAGCVERTLTITSTPPGALVTLNDIEVGRTPLSKDFTWYGTFDAQVRKEGYQTLNTQTPVIAPIWQWMPIDLIAELVPLRLHDVHEVNYTLKPISDQQIDPEAIVQRAQGLRERLESSRLPAPATKPATKSSASSPRQGKPQ